jgi:hypothetical protein
MRRGVAISRREPRTMAYTYALLVRHLGVNEDGEVGLDFFIVRVGDGRLWPDDYRHSIFEPIALYAKQATAIRDSTAQVGAYLADIVRRRGKLNRPVVPSVPVITLEDLETLYVEIVAERDAYDAALASYRSGQAEQREAERRSQREARKAEKREALEPT